MTTVVFNREQLLNRLKKCVQFIPKKAVLPAHEYFFFNVGAGVAEITAMDSEKQITTSCDIVSCTSDIHFCVPARLVLHTLNLLLESEVTFNIKDVKAEKPEDMDRCIVELKSGKSKYKLDCDKGNSYPKSPSIVSEFESSFTGSIFNSAMDVVMKFADPEGNQPFKQGVCMRLMGNTINAYATTGFKIAKVEMSPRSINKWEDIVIPVHTVKAISKIIGDIEIVDITHNKDKFEIRTEEVNIIALAYNLKYPDVETFFKKRPENKIILNSVQFANAIERLTAYAKEENPTITMNISTASLSIMVDNENHNRNGNEVIDVMAEKDLTITLNPLFLHETVKSFSSDEFTLYYSEPNGLVYIEPSSAVRENDKFFAIAPFKS